MALFEHCMCTDLSRALLCKTIAEAVLQEQPFGKCRSGLQYQSCFRLQ